MNPTHKPQPAIFHDLQRSYRADTCEPLKNAVRKNTIQLEAFGRRGYPGAPLPPKVIPELCLYCVWDARQDQNWSLPVHRNEGIELGYLVRGKLDFIVDQTVHPLSSGQLTLTRPWQPHSVGNPVVTASRMHWLILDVGMRRPNDPWLWPQWLVFAPADLQRLTQLLRFNEQPVWQGNGKIEQCFEHIAQTIQNALPEAVQTRLQLLINQLFLELLELLQKKNIPLNSHLASAHRSVEMFLDALPNHLDYPWTLEEMAHHCNLGRTRFSHYCRKITNLSPLEFLMKCRLRKAQTLLRQTPSQSITQIALACGFESSHYFATAFKKAFNLTPSQFRQPNLKPSHPLTQKDSIHASSL